jgi:hypothetical protein
MASGKMPIGHMNNVTVENCIFYLGYRYVVLSILGDTADFGRIKKERFPLLPLLKPARNRTRGCDFSTSNNTRERGLYLG